MDPRIAMKPLACAAGIVFASLAAAHAQPAAQDPPPSSRTADEQELLALHQAGLDAHLRSDIDALLSRHTEEFVSVNRGSVSTPTLAQRRHFLGPYLAATRFELYRDRVPPRVEVSRDGTLGWVVAEVEARGVQTRATGAQEPLKFVAAWVELYAKRDGRWTPVGNSSSFQEPSEEAAAPAAGEETGAAAPAAAPAPAPPPTAASATQDPMAVVRAAAEATARGDHAAAAQAYGALAEAFPTLPGAKAALGRALAQQGKLEEAYGWLEAAAATGSATDLHALRGALGPAAEQPRGAALVARFEANREPLVRSTTLLTLADKLLYPESLARDSDGTLYVGSMRQRKVVAVREGQPGYESARDFVPPKAEGMGGVIGIKVHPTRRELWVNACFGDFRPALAEPEPARIGEAGVYRYSLPDGHLVAAHRAGSTAEPVCFNDLTFTPDGDGWLSSAGGGVWRVSLADGGLERAVETPGYLVNGIATAADGRSLYLADALRGVVVLDLATRALRTLPVPEGVSLVGIDGLYVWRDSLVGVQNGLSAVGPERVVQAFLSADRSRVECVEVLERAHPAYDVPTTGAIVGDELWYVAGSGLNSLDIDFQPLPLEQLRESTILRLPLRERCGEAQP